MTNIDLRLLAVVKELNDSRSVTRTAKKLGLTQSAISMSLAKLRNHFNDELFVKTSTGMVSTPHGKEIVNQLRIAEEILRNVLNHEVTFKPATTDKTFRIDGSDITQVTMMPELMKLLANNAPSVRIDLRRISEHTPSLLESGGVDLAVGFLPKMGAGFFQQKLFSQRFVCAVGRDHPRVRNGLTVEQFQSELHLAIATTGTGHGIIPATLEKLKIKRKIAHTVPSFLGISPILMASELLVIVSERYGDYLAGTANIRTFPLPFEIPTYLITQHWHERNGRDPANRWLRRIVADLFLTSERPVARTK